MLSEITSGGEKDVSRRKKGCNENDGNVCED